MKKLKKIMVFVFMFLIAIGISPFIVEANSKAEEPILVRVGYTTDDISFIDGNGIKRGYLFDYLNELKRYENFKYEFVEADHSKQEELLNTKKIDLIFFENKDHAELNDFETSSLPWSDTNGFLCVLDKNKNNKNYEYEDFKSFNDLKVGYLEKTKNINYFKEYEKKNNFSAKLVPFKNIKEIQEAFIAGDINACFIRIMPKGIDFKVIAKINTPVDFVASYKNSEILKSFDIAMRKLAFNDPQKTLDLFKKYYPKQKKIAFTKEEKDLIAKKEKLVVAIIEDKRPLNYIKNGVNRGVISDTFKKIAETSGLNFDYKIFKVDTTAKDLEADKELNFVVADILFVKPEELANSTIPFYKDHFMIVLNRNNINDSNQVTKIAVTTKHKKNDEIFAKWWDNPEFIEYKTSHDVLNAVEDEKADEGILIEGRGRYLLKSPYYKDLFMTSTEDESISLVLKATNANNKKYIPIINKTIEMLKENNSLDIISSNVAAEPYDLSIKETLYKYNNAILLAILLLIVLIVLYIQEYRQNKALNEANKKSKAASIAKSEFLANMSHELRTPLNAIIGLNYLLKDSLNNYEIAKEYVDKISKSSKMLLSIINDILDMSAIESGKLILAREKFNIKDSVYSVTELYYAQCIKKGILYESDASCMKHEEFIGDNYRLRQVIINILSNAVKFTERGGKIDFNLMEEIISDQKSIIKIVVNDNGCGMSEEFKKRLFGEFEQEDATTVRNYGGSGLGLAICKRLVDLMKGTILVESTLGKGSTFTVEIPFEVGEKIKFTGLNEMSDLDVLIVDDALATCEYISSILDSWNVKNEYATTSSEAIKKAKDRINTGNEYNFCIIDLKMPEMNGVELAKKLKEIINKDGINKNAIMMIISDYYVSEVKEFDKNCGADCFLRKPIFPSELFDSMITKLSNHGKLNLINPFETQMVLKDMKILLAEDNRINELIVKKLLEKVGAVVTVAKNGQEALDYIRANKEKFDVVLMDIQMPVMDGYEATQKIRAINSSYTKNLPIYAMTANSFQVDIENSMKNGMDGHISKPIEPEVLFKILSVLKNG